MSYSDSSEYEDFFDEYFKTESKLLQNEINNTTEDTNNDLVVNKSNVKRENDFDVKMSSINNGNKLEQVINNNNKNEEKLKYIINETKVNKSIIESPNINEDKNKSLNETSSELNIANNEVNILDDIKILKLNESEKQFECYISNNKLKGRVTKLNATRKRIKREKEERKKLASTLNAKEKRKLFKDKYFSELISRYHKKCIKNSWLTLNHTPYYHKELFSVLYNPSLENIEFLLRKMDRMKFISYDGKNITLRNLYRFGIENNWEAYNNLPEVIRKRLHEFIFFQYKTLVTMWKHLRSEKSKEIDEEGKN